MGDGARIDLRKEERAIRRALKSAAEKARAAGVANPEFYVECERPCIYVMDGDRDEQKNSANYSAFDRQRAIVGAMGVECRHIGAKLDVGAW
jgi:hypothetical protein